MTVTANLVINATGAWADRLRPADSGVRTLRPLRGSHLVLPFRRLPVSVCLTLAHPTDRRPVFIYPWLGRTVIGTTDLDHRPDLDLEPAITAEEVDYLLRTAAAAFPGNPVTAADVVSSWSGIRPVVSSGGGRKPSRESREHVIWDDNGLISVAGGKLTTFRLIAREVLLRGARYLPAMTLVPDTKPVFRPPSVLNRPGAIRHLTWQRLRGHYGPALADVLDAGPLDCVAGTDTLWAELHWAVREEAVVHLDDLMLRRTRLGLILADGGERLLDQLEQKLTDAIGWDRRRWHEERRRYLALWRETSYLPAECLSRDTMA